MRLLRPPLLLAGVLLGSDASAAMLGLSWDNDLFVGQDKNYTNGLRLSYVGDSHEQCRSKSSVTCGLVRSTSFLPGVQTAGQRHAVTVSLQQVMVTPSDIERKTPDYGDIPYVGYSNLELGVFHWDDDELVGFGVRGGVVGPDSGAEQSQKLVHKITGSNQPEGWDNQLGQDLVGGVFATYVTRALRHTTSGGYQTEIGYGGSVNANNFDSNVEVGAFIRFGRNLPGNFLPDYAGLGTVGSLVGLFDRPGFGWEVFLGASGQYNAYSYIEENSGLYDLERRDLSGGVITGFSVRTAGGFSFSMTLQSSSSPLRDSSPINFGNMSFTWAL